MTDIVFQGSDGQPLTNSVLVSEKFDKRHHDSMSVNFVRFVHTFPLPHNAT